VERVGEGGAEASTEATAAIKFEFSKWGRGRGGGSAAGVFLSRIN